MGGISLNSGIVDGSGITPSSGITQFAGMSETDSVSIDPDVLDWQARVVSNGGSVSNSTLLAASNFAVSTKATGVWAKINRINLFCGTGLAAILVPLKVGGGNATDTNNNFVEGDYVETGSTGGLKGNGSNKWLNTGYSYPFTTSTNNNFHLSAYTTISATGTEVIMGAASGEDPVTALYMTATTERAYISSDTPTPSPQPSRAAGFKVVTTNGNATQRYYSNATERTTAVAADMSVASGNFNVQIAIFGLRIDSVATPTNFCRNYIRGYSIGTGLSAQNVTDYNTAMQTFQTALGRNV